MKGGVSFFSPRAMELLERIAVALEAIAADKIAATQDDPVEDAYDEYATELTRVNAMLPRAFHAISHDQTLIENGDWRGYLTICGLRRTMSRLKSATCRLRAVKSPADLTALYLVGSVKLRKVLEAIDRLPEDG